MKIQKIGDNDDQYFNIILYGDTGVGKTVLACTAQDCEPMQNVLVASAEGGLVSVKKVLPYYADIDVLTVNRFKEFNFIYEFLCKHVYFRDKGDIKGMLDLQKKLGNESDEHKVYNTIIIDSLTEVQKYTMYHILDMDIIKDSLLENIQIPQIKDWGESIEMMRKLIRSFRDLKMNVIFTCLEKTEKDDTTGKITIGPQLPGQLSGQAGGFVDMMARMSTKKVEGDVVRGLTLQPVGKTSAKDRLVQADSMVNPTMSKIYEAAIS